MQKSHFRAAVRLANQATGADSPRPEAGLDIIKNFVARNYIFDDLTYPELRGASQAHVLLFAIRHSALHFSKTAGQLAAVSEALDHGQTFDAAEITEIKKIVPKALISALRLADLVDMTGHDLIIEIERKYGTNTASLQDRRYLSSEKPSEKDDNAL